MLKLQTVQEPIYSQSNSSNQLEQEKFQERNGQSNGELSMSFWKRIRIYKWLLYFMMEQLHRNPKHMIDGRFNCHYQQMLSKLENNVFLA